MDDSKKQLQGSESRDIFKRYHKHINKLCYCIDADLVLVEKDPEGIVAYIDFKKPKDSVTFAEALAYNEWAKTKPVYIVEADSPERGPFSIRQYLRANWRPNPPVVEWGDTVLVANWSEYEQWELEIRNNYYKEIKYLY